VRAAARATAGVASKRGRVRLALTFTASRRVALGVGGARRRGRHGQARGPVDGVRRAGRRDALADGAAGLSPRVYRRDAILQQADQEGGPIQHSNRLLRELLRVECLKSPGTEIPKVSACVLAASLSARTAALTRVQTHVPTPAPAPNRSRASCG
jgi:hypothetical protein